MPRLSHPLDALGNWAEFKQDAGDGAAWDLDQARLHNAVNEIDTDNDHANGPDSGAITESAGPAWVSPACDAAGNTIFAPKPGDETTRRHCTYDAWNRLVEVRADDSGSPGALVATCRYDGLGRRIRKIVESTEVTYDYYYNESWQVLEVRRSDYTSGPYEQYLWDIRYIDAPVLRWQDGNDDGDADDANETLYYTNDANMNVTALVNTTGTVLERVVYDPYGTPTFYDGSWQNASSASSYANEILYCGYRFDTETGLYHVRHRMYHPTLGRWTSRDPGGYADGMSFYQYVSSSPIGLTDPSGQIGEAFRRVPSPMYRTRAPEEATYRVEGDSWRDSVLAAIAEHMSGRAGEFGPIGYTLVWIPYPGGSFDITFSLEGAIRKCCHLQGEKAGQEGWMGELGVSVSFTARVGLGMGGNQGMKRVPGSDRPPTGGSDVRTRETGRFAKNPGKGWQPPQAYVVVNVDLPECTNGFSGSVTLEIGGKAGAVVTANPYANVTFSTDDPISFDYGIRVGIEWYVGAEIYARATGRAGGTIILN